MIFAKLSHLMEYLPVGSYDKVSGFLRKVNEDIPEGEYEISGTDIFARVMSYETKVPEECKIEAHEKYIDIQVSLVGAEGISVFDRSILPVIVQYDEGCDVMFFSGDDAKCIAHTANIPGFFTMLFPEEAHRPKEIVGRGGRVKKFVIKVAVSLI